MTEEIDDFPDMNPDDPTIDVWRTPREDLQGDRPPTSPHWWPTAAFARS